MRENALSCMYAFPSLLNADADRGKTKVSWWKKGKENSPGMSGVWCGGSR
jgi:hypothetical protein